jgi:hypothetical protein
MERIVHLRIARLIIRYILKSVVVMLLVPTLLPLMRHGTQEHPDVDSDARASARVG